MANRLLNESFIRQRSEELQIPFDNLLGASVLEEIVRKIGESDYADVFWLKSIKGLRMEDYKKNVDLKLSYYMKESKNISYRKNEVSNVFHEIFRNSKQEAIQWNFSLMEEKKAVYVNINAAISNIKIPVKMKLERIMDENLMPDRREFRLFLNNNQKIQVNCFPNEYLIVEKFLDIMDKLELINDLSGYMDIYEILKKESISGRKVWELLSKGCRENGINMDEKRFELLVSYRNSNFMKKKWKAYLRHEKRKNPKWEDVICLMENFFSNIWRSMCQNVIYLGDWMPELGRFID